MLTSVENQLSELLLGNISQEFHVTVMPNDCKAEYLDDIGKAPMRIQYTGSIENTIFLSLKEATRRAN